MYSSVRTATIFKTKKVHISKQKKEIAKLKMNVDCKAEALPENRTKKKKRTHSKQGRKMSNCIKTLFLHLYKR